MLSDASNIGLSDNTATTGPTQRFGSYPNTNLQNLESQLNSIYNSTSADFMNARTPANGTQYNAGSHCATRQNSCYSFTNNQRKSFPERQRSQSLPQTNTRDAYVTNNAAYNFKQTAQNSRLPNYTNANASPQYTNGQYQFAQNERVQNTYDGSTQQYNCNQMAGYSYDGNAQYPNMSNAQTPSQPGLPSPAPASTAPAQSCFGHQHLATARHCNCNSQQCSAHFYNESNTADGQCNNVRNNVQCQPNYPTNYLNAGQYNQNVVAEGDYNVYNEDTQNMNYNVDNTAMNQNYNCNQQQMAMKYQQTQYQQQQVPAQQYQQNQFFHNQTDQRNQQQFKTPCENQQVQMRPQGVRSETELQCNVVSQSSLNMRPAAYERTLQYVEQCQMFSVSSTTNQTDSSNMIINDMTSSLNSLLEENKYLQQMIQ